jgi:23S rRNA (guanine745-N1)-methyltransferase
MNAHAHLDHDAGAVRIICPVCRRALNRQPKVWTCAQGHSFDVGRGGYVNLLLAQHKNSPDPGDNAAMVMARREFLQAGHYQPLRDAALTTLAPLRAQGLLDVGCGEGYYTSGFSAIASEVIGLDISRPAIQLAAKQFRGITWLVGSGALLPVADGSVDIICSVFSQLYIAEMHRVLKPGGHVLVVSPAADHLWTIREGLFDEVRAYESDKFLAGFKAQFDLQSRQELRVPLSLTQQTLQQLLLMTPYVWKAKAEKRAALERSESFTTQAAFSLMLFQKRNAIS